VTDSETMKHIRRRLRSPDAQVRAECVEALSALADTRGLLSATRSRDAYVRARAASGLANTKGGRITWVLLRLRADADEHVRCVVASVLARRRGWLTARARAQLANDAHPVGRYTALNGLVRIDWKRASGLLRAAMTGDQEGWIRDAAAALLRRRGRGFEESTMSDAPAVEWNAPRRLESGSRDAVAPMVHGFPTDECNEEARSGRIALAGSVVQEKNWLHRLCRRSWVGPRSA